jgi:arylsulfatase A-like enzyme
MKRRDFLKSTAAASGGLLTGFHKAAAQSDSSVPGPQPNILFILVDELRYPTVFPDKIKTPGEFLARFMKNVHKRIWVPGVKFGKHNTAANACTPSRGALITGLYSQQQWVITTILSTPTSTPPAHQPVLNTNYPTYGKLLQAAGYQTPYTGKWHVSVPGQATDTLTSQGLRP